MGFQTTCLLKKKEPFVAYPQKPAASAFKRRSKGATALKELVGECLEPSLKVKGFANAEIHLHWGEIVGQTLAPWSEPVTLKWPSLPPGADPAKARAGAALTVKVEGAFSLDLQHMTPQIIERINSYFGWRCVEKLLLKQGPVRKGQTVPVRPRKTLTPEASQALDAILAPVENAELKATLARMGVGVMTRR